MDKNPYSDKLEDVGDSPFAGEKTAPIGMSGHRDNDPNASAMEEHLNYSNRHGEASPPLQPTPDLMEDGT